MPHPLRISTFSLCLEPMAGFAVDGSEVGFVVVVASLDVVDLVGTGLVADVTHAVVAAEDVGTAACPVGG